MTLQVRGPKNDRVEVEFDDGLKALKPCNLKMVDWPEVTGDFPRL